jgi:WD40 repeat protein
MSSSRVVVVPARPLGVLLATAVLLAVAWAAPVERPGELPERPLQPLPDGAIARLGSLWLRHESEVRAIAFSPDGKKIASVARDDDTVRVWDPGTGKLLHEFHAPGILSREFSTEGDDTIAFTPDGKAIAAGVGADVCFWELESGTEVRRFRGKGKGIQALTFSRDGKSFYCGGDDNRLYQWDIASGNLVRSWDYFAGRQPRIFGSGQPEAAVALKAISPDGTTAAWVVWQWIEEKDGTVIQCPGEEVRIWDVATGKDRCRLAIEPGQRAARVVLSSDGRHVTAYEGRTTAIVWDTATGKQLRTLGSGYPADAVAYSPDGRRVATFRNSLPPRLTVWELPSSKELWHCNYSCSQGGEALHRSLAFSPNGKIIALADWKNLRIWDAESGKEGPVLAGHRAPVAKVVFSPRDRTWISADADCVCEWDAEHRQVNRHRLMRLDGRLTSVAESHETNLRICRTDSGLVQLHELTTNKLLCTLDEIEGTYQEGCFSSDGRTVALLRGGDQREVVFVDVPSHKVRSRVRIRESQDGYLALSRDGKLLASVSSDQTILLIDSCRGEIVRRLGKPRPPPRKDAPRFTTTDGVFSPDGALVAFATLADSPTRCRERDDFPPQPPGLRVWQVATGRELLRFDNCLASARSGQIASLVFSPDNRSLAVALNFSLPQPGTPGKAERATVPVVEVASGRLRRRLKGHTDEVNSVAFSPDGKVLASGGEDTTILLWDMTRPMAADPAVAGPTLDRLRVHWNNLASRDAEHAYDAVLALAAMPEESVAFLAARLQSVEAPSKAHLAQWIADLDAAAFQLREEADAKLTAAHEFARPTLKAALSGKLSVEARRRIREMLTQLDAMTYPPALLQQLRAVEVLERIATPEARRVLDRLATGAPEAIVTIDARASLARLNAAR